jgi:phosphonate dehydrogenase
MSKIVVANRIFPETRALLAPHGALDVNENLDPWSPDELRERCRNADALLAFMTERLDVDFFSACPKLQIVAAALKGYDNIDIEAATRHGVRVTIVPDLLTIPTAELAIGLMLALGRNILAGDRAIRERDFAGWRPELYGAGLDGATVGIIGYGAVGQAIAHRLAVFGCRLLASDADEHKITAPVEGRTFDEILPAADYLVLALPLNARTLRLIDATALSRMKRGARLINPARGSLVDEVSVAEALAEGRLAGYAADVFECEDWARTDRPRSIDPRLCATDAPTVLTPHIGSAVIEARRAIERSAAQSIIDALCGRSPAGSVN